jgi:hypothetical protein
MPVPGRCQCQYQGQARPRCHWTRSNTGRYQPATSTSSRGRRYSVPLRESQLVAAPDRPQQPTWR